MQRVKTVLGYTGAGATVAAAVLAPMLLMPLFARGVAATGVRVDPSLSGGRVVREIPRAGYRILVHEVVRPRAPLQRTRPFVQVAFTPAAALPAAVDDAVDLDGDGRDDVRVRFAPGAASLRADLEALGPLVRPACGLTRESRDGFVGRVHDAVVVRVPLAR